MKFKAFTDAVSRHADTRKQGIDVADVSRVLRVAFDVLSKMKPADMGSVVLQGINLAEKRKAKKK